jgi:hypothetical protein
LTYGGGKIHKLIKSKMGRGIATNTKKIQRIIREYLENL